MGAKTAAPFFEPNIVNPSAMIGGPAWLGGEPNRGDDGRDMISIEEVGLGDPVEQQSQYSAISLKSIRKH